MKITLYRQDIHKNVIVEISTKNTKILLDCGVSLDENEVLLLPELQAQYSFADISAVFLSHYNTDHITMTRALLEAVPVYVGKLAGKIAIAAESYKAKKPFSFAGYYENGVSITVGEIKITPFLVDDSLHEGYMLLIEGDGKLVLYTGDYHANGRKSFEEMLSGLKTKIDVLLCEGGILTGADTNPITERDLEEQATELIKQAKGPVFVLTSITDFDRITTLFRAAKRNKRIFLEDLYLSEISSAADTAMPNPESWGDVRAYLTTGYKPEHFRYQLFTTLPRMSKAEIIKQSFVMCIRPSMKKYLKTLSQELHFRGGLIINSLPDETAKSESVSKFLAFAAERGLKVHTLRSSGHANALALKTLIETINPLKIVPLSRKETVWLSQNYQKSEIIKSDIIDC